jgi:geranylgeranyl reductase family protein
MATTISCDILVIGSGPAGSTAAFLLASRGYDVILVDKKLFPRPKLCAGLLTWKSIALIQSIYHLSVQDLIAKGLITHQTANYRIFHKTAQIAGGRLDYPFHFIERQNYDLFWMQAAARAGVRTMTGQAVIQIHPDTGEAVLDNGMRMRAHTIIGADGAASLARRSIYRSRREARLWKNQLAMTVETRLDLPAGKPLQDYAALYFGYIPWGYIWSFPNRRYHIAGIANLWRKSDLPAKTALNRFLTASGISAKDVQPLGSHPLPMGNYLDPPGRGRVLLVGDACGLADPLLGEGIYYAHRSAQIAAQCIIQTGPGSIEIAPAYQRALTRHVLTELRWIKAFRNILYAGGARRRFRGLKLFFRVFPKRLEAAVHGQISFAGLLCPFATNTPRVKTDE